MTDSKKTSIKPTMGDLTKQERNDMTALGINVLVEMMQERHPPTSRRIGDAIVSGMNTVALGSRGTEREAARLIGVPRSTFMQQLRRGLADVCHYLPMHEPLDDALFPFVRVRWDSSDLDFVHQYMSWIVDTIQPRAHTEETKIVLFQNFSSFGEPQPTDEFISTMAAEAGAKTDIQVVRGIVVFAPSHPGLMQMLDPINSSKGEEYKTGALRFATDPNAALSHAASLFAAASVTPPNLTLD